MTKQRNPIPDPLHFVGVGGSGMLPLAIIAKGFGYTVTGSDAAAPKPGSVIERLGIAVTTGHAAENLGTAKTVVCSSAIQSNNPEVLAAKERGLNIIHRSDLLANLLNPKRGITVAGTHGKTTSTAMLAFVLQELGLDPTAYVGGTMTDLKSPARVGQSDLFVAEADESDGTLLKYTPFIALVTNIDPDHMDFFGSMPNVMEMYTQHLVQITPEGVAVLGWDNPRVRSLGDVYPGAKITFGTVLGSEVRGARVRHVEGGVAFDAIVERDLVEIDLGIPGVHNVLNALGVLATVRALELDLALAAEALARFKGVKRRLEVILKTQHLTILDDYAHNPGKIAASVATLRSSWPNHHVIVIYQPHRFSRLQTMYNETVAAFIGADEVVVCPVYSAGETASLPLSASSLAGDIENKSRAATKHVPSLFAAEEYAAGVIQRNLATGGRILVATLGAGDVSTVATNLAESFIATKEK